jgi:Exopolyphosphatase
VKKNKKYGIIDVGSNTVRLVIYQVNSQMVFSEEQNIKLPVRLYQYLDEERQLSEEGIDNLVRVLNLFQKIIENYSLESVVATATAVIRQAKNRQEILATVKKATGLTLRLLSDEEEAYYGHYAIVRTTSYSEAYTVDMGGGSTEVTYFKKNKIVHSHSFPFGVVTLKQLFFEESENSDALKRARKYVKEQLATLDWLVPREIPIIAIGGSSRNIATVHERMTEFPSVGIHQYRMVSDDLEDTLELFKGLTIAARQSLDGLSKDRADIIIPANVTFLALMKQIEAPSFIFCNKGLREGLLMEQINQDHPGTFDPERVREVTIERFVATHQENSNQTKKRVAIIQLLLAEIQKKELLTPETEHFLPYIKYGSKLYHIGSAIEEDDSAFHSFYLVANSNLNGFTHKERISLALLASFKNKSLFKLFSQPFKSWFKEEELKYIRLAGSLIKFAESLNVVNVNEIKAFELIEEKERFTLKVDWSIDPIAEEYRANRQKKHLENVIQKKVSIDFKKIKS